jgi:hypothetical protein
MTQRPRRHWRWAFGLGAALILAQWLGLAHGVLHAHAATKPIASTPWFDDHGEPDCRLFDQAAHGDLLVAGFIALPAALPPLPRPERHRAWHVAQQAAGALARGPPRIG